MVGFAEIWAEELGSFDDLLYYISGTSYYVAPLQLYIVFQPYL